MEISLFPQQKVFLKNNTLFQYAGIVYKKERFFSKKVIHNYSLRHNNKKPYNKTRQTKVFANQQRA